MRYTKYMIVIRETEYFKSWMRVLKDRQTKQVINARIRRISIGNFGDTKQVGNGISELRINHGPGYRVYFVQRGKEIVVLLCGGNKSTQSRDITAARDIAANLDEEI
jgi:putative addiction module killer protein